MEQEGTERSVGEVLLSPISGTARTVDTLSDPMFSMELLGPSAAIDPASTTLRAPASGTVVTLPDTFHAVGIITGNGADILIHVGIDSVSLNGAPFSPRVKVGSRVEAGDPLMEIDLDAIAARGLDPVVIVIVMNPDRYSRVEVSSSGSFEAGDQLIRLIDAPTGIQSVS